jgi:hypothetical protein
VSFRYSTFTALHLQNDQCESEALDVQGLTGDYQKARIMVILFAEPRWKIKPGWRIYFSAIKPTGSLQKFTDCGAESLFGNAPG